LQENLGKSKGNKRLARGGGGGKKNGETPVGTAESKAQWGGEATPHPEIGQKGGGPQWQQ